MSAQRYIDRSRYRLKSYFKAPHRELWGFEKIEAEERRRKYYTVSTEALIHIWVVLVFLFFILLIATKG